MILKSLVFGMLACVSLQEKVFSSDNLNVHQDLSEQQRLQQEQQRVHQDGSQIIGERIRHDEPKKNCWSRFSCCSSKQVLESVVTGAEMVGQAAPAMILAFGSAVVEDALDDGEVNGSAKSAYAKAVADTIRAFNLKGKFSAVANASAGMVDVVAQDLKDGKLNDHRSAYLKAAFDNVELFYPDAEDHEKEASVLVVLILDLIKNDFDMSHKQSYIRDFNGLVDVLKEKAQGNTLLISGLESAEGAFPMLLGVDQSTNKQQYIEIIRKAILPFHIMNASTGQERTQNLALSTLDVVLSDVADGKLDGKVGDDSKPYIELAAKVVAESNEGDEK